MLIFKHLCVFKSRLMSLLSHVCLFVCFLCEQVPSSEEAVTPSSAMTPSASGASSRPFIPVTDDPGAASIIAETMTKTKEVSLLDSPPGHRLVAPLCHLYLLGFLQDSESQSKVIGPEPQYLDEFTSLLVPDDTRVMVDLLKLAVSCRSGEKGRDVLSAVLSGMGTAYPQVIHSILHFYLFQNHRPRVRSCSKTDNLLSLAPGPTQSVCGPVQHGRGQVTDTLPKL